MFPTNKKFLFLLILYLLTIYNVFLPNGLYLIIVFSISVFVLMPLRFNLNTLYIIMFSLIYSFIMMLYLSMDLSITIISYLLAPIAFYMWGNYVLDNCIKNDFLDKFILLTILIFPFVLYVSVIGDIINNGFINIMRSLELNEGTSRTATGYGINVSLGFIGLIAFIKGKKNIVSYLYLGVFIMSLVVVVHLLNRTGLFVALIWSLIGFMFIYRGHKTNLVKSIVVLASIICLFIYLGLISDDLLAFYATRAEEDMGQSRIVRWFDALYNLFYYPFGWYRQSVTSYVHNMWLDVLRVAGFIPFFIILIVTIRILKLSYIIYSRDQENKFINVIGVNICFLLSASVEPIIEALPLYFYLWFMIIGMIDRILYRRIII